MTEHKARPEPWQADAARWLEAILELRDRVQVLEDAAHKHIVETSSNVGALFRRMESLEAAERPASKVHEISEPLQLTPEQAQQLMDLLTPDSKPSAKGPLLITRVAAAISQDGESINWSGACAAIREVAAWLREQKAVDLPDHTQWAAARAAAVLEQEAER